MFRVKLREAERVRYVTQRENVYFSGSVVVIVVDTKS